MQGFHKPKVFDPSVASQPTPQRERGAQQLRAQDLGFDADVELEDKNKELKAQIEALHAQATQLQEAVTSAKDCESLTTRKLQSFQQVNRSQNALMRAELQKCRRRLAHTQEVAKRLQKQSEWLQGMSPTLCLPEELQGLPTEEQEVGEAAELAQQHQRWENDVAQLAAQLQADMTKLGGAATQVQSSSEESSKRSEESSKRAAELELALERQANEVKQLKQELMQRPQVAQPTEATEAPKISKEGAMAVMEAESLRQELEAKEKDAGEMKKKLKQLASAYKHQESLKKDVEARLGSTEKSLEQAIEQARVEAAKPKVPQGPVISPELLNRIKSQMASQRTQLADLRASVSSGFKQELPGLLQAALQEQVPRLEQLIASGSKVWETKFWAESDRRRKLHNVIQEMKGNIRVYCRVRPLNERERESGSSISFPDADSIQIANPELGLKKAWQFNEIFNEASTQANVFAGLSDLVVSMLDGYNVCVFAYGQTGAGKTHSMQGTSSDPGIYARTFQELFKGADQRKGNIELTGSILEIYNEEIRDLLYDGDTAEKRPKLQVKMGKDSNLVNYVPGLTKVPIKTSQEVEALLESGQKNRKTACTDMNHHSSRSHLLVQIYASVTSTSGKTTNSVITLVDLAGSERLAKSGVTGDRAKEAIAINKSLSALGDVINSRAAKSAHTPFRNSTLTHLLQDSLSGDSKTLMLLQINPCKDYVEESMCSLQFGARVNAVELKDSKK